MCVDEFLKRHVGEGWVAVSVKYKESSPVVHVFRNRTIYAHKKRNILYCLCIKRQYIEEIIRECADGSGN